MAAVGTTLLVASGTVAMSMAWAIGAQDVSNALGTSVGSKALTVSQAIVVGAVMEFLGSLVGGDVAATISGGILSMDSFEDGGVSGMAMYAHCMFCTMAGASMWLAVATYYSLPVSTTHSLVGALIGVGVMARGVGGIQWANVGRIVSSWITSPMLGGIIAYAIFSGIHTSILTATDPTAAAKRVTPVYTAATAGVLVSFLCLSGPSQWRLGSTAASALGVAVAAAVLAMMRSGLVGGGVAEGEDVLPQTAPHGGDTSDSGSADGGGDAAASAGADAGKEADADGKLDGDRTQRSPAERSFTTLMIVTACVVSFAHGSNDVSNSIGPFNALYEIYAHGRIRPGAPVPLWVLVAGGTGIVVGLGTYGHKVMATVGQKIARLTFSRGYAAQIGTALTVLTATQLGVSVSTTHCLIGAISGVALVEGRDKLNTATLKRIVVSWVVTIPAAAAFTVLLYGVLPIGLA
uniref:Phosphate transporter n=1 Tax=Bicosoecida sp. CB-2014 TaxID=1486930 RepID=A0A7S1CA17_9STRA|mmetsp:Transcript_19091/g.67429  ORF Transcript_19091/g.67429 Transcript_19091/m.67429 type:complete len:463 (+) Transcript_19091:35-1423(+)